MSIEPGETRLRWNGILLDQVDFFWEQMFGPRLDGLSDEEYLWEPVVDCWTVRRGAGRRRGVRYRRGDVADAADRHRRTLLP